jgi:hypothetical protein
MFQTLQESTGVLLQRRGDRVAHIQAGGEDSEASGAVGVLPTNKHPSPGYRVLKGIVRIMSSKICCHFLEDRGKKAHRLAVFPASVKLLEKPSEFLVA